MKSNLEIFCEKVAFRAYEVDNSVVDNKNLGIDIMTILALVEVIAPIVIQLIQNCPNKSNLKSSVKSPNWLQKVRFRAMVKDSLDTSGYHQYRSMSGKVAEAFLAESAKLKDEEVSKIVEETTVDNWLI